MSPIYCHPGGFSPDCPLCRRVQSDPALHAALAGVPAPAWEGGPAAESVEPAEPCDWVGTPAKPPPGKSASRRWTLCEHPSQPVGQFVCGCEGCGPACPGYNVSPHEFPPVVRRHLVYHILPVHGPVWRRGVDQLRLRWSLFTGAKVIGVARGGPVAAHDGDGVARKLESPDAVRAYLPPDCDVIEYDNDPRKWELSGWPRLWDRVLSGAGDDDAVLYAHAKGVTRPAHPTVHEWAEVLYTLALDYWHVTERLLAVCPVAGPFRRLGPFFLQSGNKTAGMDRSRWHYSGNFWWARVGPVRKALAEVPVPPDPWGTEAWPGIAFADAGAGSQWAPKVTRHQYRESDWRLTLAEFNSWRATHPPTAPPPFLSTVDKPPSAPARSSSFSVIVPTSGRAALSRCLNSVTSQLRPGDEVIVKSDDSRDWGGTPRNSAMSQARGSWLLFMDDDDVYLPGALDAVRKVVAGGPRVPHVFRVRRGEPYNDLIPATGVTVPRLGQVSTQCVVVPNDPGRLGEWGKRYASDWDFLASTLAKYPAGSVVMRPEVVAYWRPPDPPRGSPG